MSQAEDVAKLFYEAFERKDADAMAALYAPDATFSDPVFQNLTGVQAGQMWRMLLSGSKDLSIEFFIEESDDQKALILWDAWYTFSKTGRAVHNIIRANIEVRDGKIIKHVDAFSFWAWSQQALGIAGTALGWTPFMKKKVQQEAMKSLEKFISKS